MAIIKQLQGMGTYESQYGTFYKFEATLDDGRMGEVSTKKPDTWKVGDTVDVEATTGNYGTKFKFKKPELQARPQDKSTQNRIDASWAIGQAISAGSRSLEEIEETAKALLKLRDKMLEDGTTNS